MAREWIIAWAGRHQRDAWEELCARYRRRLERFVAVRDVPVKPPVKGRGGGEEEARRRAEGRALLAAVPDPCWIVALDRGGRALGSPRLSRVLTRLRDEWPHPVAFVIGSDLGLAPEVLAAARRVLSFGPMTLPHELARLVLYEQLYRALSIEAGIHYHRGAL